MSESIDPGQYRLLDEVRAKIFYLASDIEPANPPAAILLRAVAEAIEDPQAESAIASGLAEAVNGHAAMNGPTPPLRYQRANEIFPAPLRVPNGVPPLRQDADAAVSPGQKR